MDSSIGLQARQIVFLEHRDSRLYAEVVQVVPSRQLCWVRPLVLVTLVDQDSQLTDLSSCSDLLWPISLFRPAMDVEVIPLLTQMLALESSEQELIAKQQLHHFINLVWQDYTTTKQ
ncbi:MAG: hypothetical protein VKL59_19245 [Nostocaceae cyanobacterium]|nr:hypothetical protein [Nostocaceae cyanobacterium]